MYRVLLYSVVGCFLTALQSNFLVNKLSLPSWGHTKTFSRGLPSFSSALPTRLHSLPPCLTRGLCLLLFCTMSLLTLVQGGSKTAKTRGTCFSATESITSRWTELRPQEALCEAAQGVKATQSAQGGKTCSRHQPWEGRAAGTKHLKPQGTSFTFLPCALKATEPIPRAAAP